MATISTVALSERLSSALTSAFDSRSRVIKDCSVSARSSALAKSSSSAADSASESTASSSCTSSPLALSCFDERDWPVRRSFSRRSAPSVNRLSVRPDEPRESALLDEPRESALLDPSCRLPLLLFCAVALLSAPDAAAERGGLVDAAELHVTMELRVSGMDVFEGRILGQLDTNLASRGLRIRVLRGF